MLTGVSKFSQMSLFSKLNNLIDITIDEEYGTIIGYTHNDLETTFKEHLRNSKSLPIFLLFIKKHTNI